MTRGTVTGRISVMVEAELHLYAIVILRLSAPDTSSLTHDGSWHPLAHLPEMPIFRPNSHYSSRDTWIAGFLTDRSLWTAEPPAGTRLPWCHFLFPQE